MVLFTCEQSIVFAALVPLHNVHVHLKNEFQEAEKYKNLCRG